MTDSLMDSFVDAYNGIGKRNDHNGAEVIKAFADTFAVIQAGWASR